MRSDLQKGLSTAEAADRLAGFGPNTITSRRGKPRWLRLALQFHEPLVYILVIASAATFFVGEHTDGAIILAVVLINALVGYLQESKASGAIDALARSMRIEATVRRDGTRRRLHAAEVVVGDIVLLEAGDRVPADLRLLTVRELKIDESMLTGESDPVSKGTDPLPLETELADRRNMAYAGTLVTRGTAEGAVVATADATEVGRINRMIASSADLATPLTRKITEFSRVLLWLIVVVAAVTFAVGVARGNSAKHMFRAAIAMAVAAIPEGLPAAMTVMLAVGVSRMARRQAIIRRLPAVEVLGSTTVICTDKTGTLTQNRMTVTHAWVHPCRPNGEGRLYDLVEENQEDLAENLALAELLTCGVLCNDAALVLSAGRQEVHGEPTEAALLIAAQKAGLTRESLIARLPRVDAIPFESERRYMATLHRRAGASHGSIAGGVVYVKGAVERVLELSAGAIDQRGQTVPLDPDAVSKAAAQFSATGLRVLAFARQEIPEVPTELTPAMLDRSAGMTFLGLQAMLDPPRPEAIQAVAACRAAGIQVKMITGDHALTATRIAEMMGINSSSNGHPPRFLIGAQMAGIPDQQLPELAERTSVFARMSSEQKLRLVEALQRRGHIVAMTGDGVNDAPALRRADIGVAMGLSGTDVAKQAADVVLTDDNFASIEAAVEEGRSVFTNLAKFVLWTLPTNVGEGFLITAAILLGWPLPILPVHALYINTLTAVLLGMPLVFEAGEPDVMSRPPRNPRRPLLTVELFMRTGLVSLLLGGGAMGLFHWELARGAGEPAARTAAVSVLVIGEVFYLFSSRSLLRPAWSVSLLSNPWLLGGVAATLATQFAFASAPTLNRLFHSAPLQFGAWSRAIAIGAALLVTVEAEKAVRRFSMRT